MWKRLQGHGRDKEKQIGNPVLLETTYDEDRLRHIPNVTAAQNAAYHTNNSHHNSQAYDNHLTPRYDDYNNEYNRASVVPTVSSIYSQPSPDPRYNYGPGRPTSADISPPSSPDSEQDRDPNVPRRFRSMRDVSPVDESRGRSHYSMRAPSSIPVLRKAPPSLRDQEQPNASTRKFWGGKVAPNSKVRWDEYSGEPTSSNAGKSASVTPGSFAVNTLTSPSERRSVLNAPVSATEVPLAERANRFGTRPPPVETKPRVEPWSRAVGRSEIARPLKDQPSDKPLNFTRKPESASSVEPSQDTSEELTTIQEEHIKPVVPLKVGRNSPIASPTTPRFHGKPGSDSYPSPTTPTNIQSVVSSSNGPTITRNQPVQPPSNAPAESFEHTPESIKSKHKEQDSRFSWTTYNSSTTYQHSPPPSPPPPLPNSTPVEPLSAASAILNHKQATSVAVRAPIRKPVGESTAKIMQPKTRASSDPPSPRPESTFSTSTHKALPRPPAELTTTDHVVILESQMEDLRIRRNNVYRLLNDLNNMAPPNPMITDFRRMRLVEQRKKDFENELAEIRVEEHDVGLKLHRAFRKREAMDPNGGSSALWVRRVTR